MMFLTTSSFLPHFCVLFLLFAEKHYFVATRVMVAWPAQVTHVTQVPITLTQHDTAAALCDTTHPMWRHRGMARPEPPPPALAW